MAHKLDGFELRFTGRRSWKAERKRDGKLIDVVPVTWTKDLYRDRDQQFLRVWFRDPNDLEEYRTRHQPYIVAVAQAKDYRAKTLSFAKFDSLLEVVSTGKRLDDDSVEVRVLSRVGAEAGEMLAPQKVTRISYNSKSWRKPTGEAKGLEAGGTYNQEYGFGHEEWLFRDEWTIAGWRYAFLQGVNKSLLKLIEAGEALDVTLFTVQPDKRRRYVARIRNMECLSDDQAEAALAEFKKRGWLDTMLGEIKDVDGDPEALGNAQWARHILNVRFRQENITYFPESAYVTEADPIMRWNRYLLYDAPQQKQNNPDQRRERVGLTDDPDTKSYFRTPGEKVEVSPEHAKMQKRLMSELREELPNALMIERERNFIDVIVKTETDLYLYEIKSDLSPFYVLRAAIGQLLEYAFYQPNASKRRLHLIAVGRTPLSAAAENYLNHLRQTFGMPLEYRVVGIGCSVTAAAAAHEYL